MHGWTDGWMDGRMCVYIYVYLCPCAYVIVCVYYTHVIFGTQAGRGCSRSEGSMYCRERTTAINRKVELFLILLIIAVAINYEVRHKEHQHTAPPALSSSEPSSSQNSRARADT